MNRISKISLIAAAALLAAINLQAQNLSFSGGWRYTTILCQDGNVYAAGRNAEGQLGRGVTGGNLNDLQPVLNFDGTDSLSGIWMVDAGSGNHALALSFCGDTVWSWGGNSNGQAGIGTVGGNSNLPQMVLGPDGVNQLQDIKFISGGNSESYAITEDGLLLTWGENVYGQLGHGFLSKSESIPNYVLKGPGDTLKNVTFVDGGDDFSIALTESGHVYYWGSEAYRLEASAHDTATAVRQPYAQIVLDPNGDTLTDIVRLTAGDVFALAQSGAGKIFSWGYNWGGALGNGTETSANTTSQVINVGGIGFLNNVKSLAAGNQHAIAVLWDGKVVSWGNNAQGQVGNGGNGGQISTPVYVMLNATDTLVDVIDISEGDNWSFALMDDGTFYVWGENNDGQLGLPGGNQDYPTLQNTLPCAVGFDVVCPIANINAGGISADTLSFCGQVIGTLNAGIQGNYAYRWWKDGTLMDGADDAIITLSGHGTYVVEISTLDTLCDGTPYCGDPSLDSVVVVADQIAAINDTLCMPGPAQLVVTQEGGFKWYDDPTAGNLLAIGDTLNTGVLTGDTVFYVEDTSLVFMSFGYDIADTRLGGNAYTETYSSNELGLTFNSLTDFSLDSLTLFYGTGGSCWSHTANVAVTINLDNVTDATQQTFAFTLECSMADTAVRLPVDFDVLEGKEYALSLANINLPYKYYPDGADYSSDQYFENVVQVVGSPSADADDYGPFFDLAISFEESCGRTPVYAINGLGLETALPDADTICGAGTAILDAGVFQDYIWSTTETTQTIEVSAAGKYYVTATAPGGCFVIDSTEIVAGDVTITSIVDSTICSDESVTLDPGSFVDYDWSTGAGTATITVSDAGSYGVTVTDATGCIGSASMTLTVNDLPILNLRDTLICSTGLVSATIGTGDLYDEYLWSTTATTDMIDVSVTGDYGVTVTNSGCSAAGSINVGLFDEPVVTLNDGQTCVDVALTIDAGAGFAVYNWSTGDNGQTISTSTPGNYAVTITDVNGCIGSDDMDLTLLQDAAFDIDNQLLCANETYTANPGAYNTYNWSDGSSAPTLVINSAGDFSVTVSNADGCTAIDSFMVTLLPSPEPLLLDTTICVESTITLNPGASGTLTYSWSTNESTQTIDVSTPGSYSVTITNNDNCQDQGSMTLSQHAPAVVSLGGDDAICLMDTLTLDAGNFAFYTWNTGDMFQTVEAAIAGTYSVTVTDANGCMDVDSMDLTVNDLPVIDLPDTDTFCPDSTMTLDPGTFDAYVWSQGAGSTIDVTTAGSYSVTVTDANGCESSHTTVLEQFNKPAILDGNITSFCENEMANAMAASGFLSYLWQDGSTTETIGLDAATTVHITVTDANCGWRDTLDITTDNAPAIDIPIANYPKCPRSATQIIAVGDNGLYTWSNGEAGNDLTSITVLEGNLTYVVTVTDLNTGCSDTASTFVSNDPVVTFDVADQTVCPESQVSMTITQDASYATYAWSNGGSTNSIDVFINDTITYTVTVTDVNGCEIVDEDGITLTPAEVPTAVATTRGVPICNGDANAAIEINISGGHAPYSLIYMVDDVVQLPIEGIDTTYVELTNIEENAYTILEVRDSNDCDLGAVFDTTIVDVVEVNVEPAYSISVAPGCEEVTVSISDESSDNVVNWQWTANTADGRETFSEREPTFSARYNEPLNIELIVTEADYGCSDTLEVSHSICSFDECMDLRTDVNVFTPNGDNINDLLDFDPNHAYDECIYLKVYDRWGRSMYESPRADIENRWDGSSLVDGDAPGGTYYYILQLWDYQHTGSATLIRD